ncbi:MAG: PRC-barrel domain-containing protein [Gloeobacteraceae cyanobacterium ES-bin-144]|nr:PRC-barrel domain-containing protein [Verrucomicrobiales bacterium]
MKAIQRNILISMIPLLTPMTVFAETHEKTVMVTPTSRTSRNADTWRASEVIGQNVKNSGDEVIGEVQDLLIDMKSGQIHSVVISSGGFLGIADTLSAVPVTALRFDSAAKAFKTKLTKEQLGKAPQFKTTSWPDYSDATTIEAMRSYRDSIGGDGSAPDNSAQNDKAQNKNSLTAIDQGNSEKDIQITKDIRTSVIATELSFSAKNIQIITKDENVVLRGELENHTEHQAILKIAKNHANASKITDELTVKAK